MKRILRSSMLFCLVSVAVISFMNTELFAAGGNGLKIKSGKDAIAVVKKLVGKKASKYKFELDEDNQVIPDGNGNYAASRESEKVSNGIDCYVVRVFKEVTKKDSVSQDNLGWFFVSKSTGKVYKMTDPYQTNLEVLK